MPKSHPNPTLDLESQHWQAGLHHVAGVDEAGRGALAGPVAAAAVIVPAFSSYEGVWSQVRDSKLLKPSRRENLASMIKEAAVAWGVGVVSASTIDEIGIATATRLAMGKAIGSLKPTPDYLLIDWVRLSRINLPQESFAKADQISVSVAAASILAKVHRDRLMVQLGDHYPRYDFGANKGYGTPKHLVALGQYGACAQHRHRFAPIAGNARLFDQPAMDNEPQGRKGRER